jgi:predicted enzyme related to lactoylglutathione lyase
VPNPIVHWEIWARDRKKLQEFYGRLFDWRINDDNPMKYGLVDTAAGGINGGIMQVDPGQPLNVTFYVHVEDLAATLAKVAELGGKTVVPPTPIPDVGMFALFLDPEGHCLGIIKMQHAPKG